MDLGYRWGSCSADGTLDFPWRTIQLPPAVIDYVTFMKVQKTAYLKIRFDLLYSIYAIFAVAMIIRYLWLGYQVIWGKGPIEYDPTKASSGV